MISNYEGLPLLIVAYRDKVASCRLKCMAEDSMQDILGLLLCHNCVLTIKFDDHFRFSGHTRSGSAPNLMTSTTCAYHGH